MNLSFVFPIRIRICTSTILIHTQSESFYLTDYSEKPGVLICMTVIIVIQGPLVAVKTHYSIFCQQRYNQRFYCPLVRPPSFSSLFYRQFLYSKHMLLIDEYKYYNMMTKQKIRTKRLRDMCGLKNKKWKQSCLVLFTRSNCMPSITPNCTDFTFF